MPATLRWRGEAWLEHGRAESNKTMSVTEEQVMAGQAVYTERMLRAYDTIVLRLSTSAQTISTSAWEQATSSIAAGFRRRRRGLR